MSEDRGGERSLEALEQDVRDTRRRIGDLLAGIDRDYLLRPGLRLALRAARKSGAPGTGGESGPGAAFVALAVAAALAGFAAGLLRRRRSAGLPAEGGAGAARDKRDAAK